MSDDEGQSGKRCAPRTLTFLSSGSSNLRNTHLLAPGELCICVGASSFQGKHFIWGGRRKSLETREGYEVVRPQVQMIEPQQPVKRRNSLEVSETPAKGHSWALKEWDYVLCSGLPFLCGSLAEAHPRAAVPPLTHSSLFLQRRCAHHHT
jgi:hypothetical protein